MYRLSPPKCPLRQQRCILRTIGSRITAKRKVAKRDASSRQFVPSYSTHPKHASDFLPSPPMTGKPNHGKSDPHPGPLSVMYGSLWSSGQAQNSFIGDSLLLFPSSIAEGFCIAQRSLEKAIFLRSEQPRCYMAAATTGTSAHHSQSQPAFLSFSELPRAACYPYRWPKPRGTIHLIGLVTFASAFGYVPLCANPSVRPASERGDSTHGQRE